MSSVCECSLLISAETAHFKAAVIVRIEKRKCPNSGNLSGFMEIMILKISSDDALRNSIVDVAPHAALNIELHSFQFKLLFIPIYPLYSSISIYLFAPSAFL